MNEHTDPTRRHAARSAPARTPGEREPPNDHATEVAVLGALMLAPEMLSTVRGILDGPRDFYGVAHATIYAAMLAIADRSQHIDVPSMAAELRRHDHLNTVGGAARLVELTDTIPTTAFLDEHARVVAELAVARRVLAAAERIVADGYAGRIEPALYPSKSIEALAAAGRGAGAKGVVTLDAVCAEAFDALVSGGSASPPAVSAVAALDDAVRLRGPQLVIIAARPAMGKSALALQYAVATAATHRRVLFVSQEMRPAELIARALIADTTLDADEMARGVMPHDAGAQLTAAANRIERLPIAFTRALDVSAEEVASEALRQHASAPLGLVVIDYLTLLRKPRADREDLAVGAMTRRLKLLAMELGCPVMVLAQLNRKCDERPDKRPHLSDLRQSGDVEQDADVVVFVYRDEVYDPNTKDKGIAELIARKVRGGRPCTVRVGFDGPRTRFHDLPGYVTTTAAPAPLVSRAEPVEHWQDDTYPSEEDAPW